MSPVIGFYAQINIASHADRYVSQFAPFKHYLCLHSPSQDINIINEKKDCMQLRSTGYGAMLHKIRAHADVYISLTMGES